MSISEDQEIKEYITAPSKRGAAISSALSLVFILFAIGIADLSQPRSFPVAGLPIKPDFAPILLYLIMAFSFISWLYRFEIERRYAGKFIQPSVKDLISDLRHKIINQYKEQDLGPNEAKLESRFPVRPEYRDLFKVDMNAPTGFKYSRIADVDVSKYDGSAMQYFDAQKSHKERTRLRQNAEDEIQQLKKIDGGLSWHSEVTYVYIPISLYFSALLSEVLRQFSIFPIVN